MQSQVPDSHILYVGNLSPKVDEAAVRRFFRHYGDIVSIQFVRKGYIFCNVSFARKEDAERSGALVAQSSLEKPLLIMANHKEGFKRQRGGFVEFTRGRWAVIRLDTEEAVNNALNLDGCVHAPPYPKHPFLTRPGGGRYAFLNALMNDELAQQSRRFDAFDAALKVALEGGCNASCDLCR
ncbi:hypothetical protein LguiA_029594 [Lonicera macranthoides]